MIQGNGSSAPLILIVADSPTKEEAAAEMAFIGTTGKRTNALFQHAGIRWEDTYRTLYIKELLSYNGPKKMRVKKAMSEVNIEHYQQILTQEIVELNPKVIIATGDFSCKFLTGHGPLDLYRGSVLTLNPAIQKDLNQHYVRVVPAYGILKLIQDPTAQVYTILDYKKAKENIELQGPIENNINVWVCRDALAFKAFLDRMRDKWDERDESEKFMTTDIETYMGIPTCISFCFNDKEAVSIPIFDERIDKINATLLIYEIGKLLASQVPKVNQNIKYDSVVLERFGLRVNSIQGDTVLGFHLLYPELPKNLGFQNSIYTNIPYFKDESGAKDTYWNPKLHTKDTLYLYNAKDSLSTWIIHREQQKELKEAGLDRLYNEKIMPLFHIYKKIDETGIRVDTIKRNELKIKYETQKDIFQKQLEIEANRPLNPNSSKQVCEFIYEELKFPWRKKRSEDGEERFTADKNTLDELCILHGEENKKGAEGKRLLQLIILCRKIGGVLNYINTPLHPGDIWKCNYNLAGTETGRTSATKTLDTQFVYTGNGKYIKKRLGRSLQTITKHGFQIDEDIYMAEGEDRKIAHDLRSMFVPRHGKIFVEGDESQAEARVVAVLAEDWELLESFDKKPKIHAKTAALLFGVDANTITKDSPTVPIVGLAYYDIGKKVRHAGNYDEDAFGLAKITHLDISFCMQAITKFHQTNPNIRLKYHYDIIQYLRKYKNLVTPFGRRRDFFGEFNKDLIRKGLAHIPQSVVSERLKFSMIDLAKDYPSANFLVEAHDSLLSEVNIGEERDYAVCFKRCIEQPIDFNPCSISRDFELTIPVEMSVGMNWKDMEEIYV